MKNVGLQSAKVRLDRLIKHVEETGEIVTIYRRGVPIADLVPHAIRKRRTKPDPFLSRIVIRYNPTEPLSDREWPAEAR